MVAGRICCELPPGVGAAGDQPGNHAMNHRSRRDPQTALKMRLRELAASRGRFGYQRLTILADYSLSGQKVAFALSQVIAERGAPVSITVDNGSEFYSRPMEAWAYQYGVRLVFIRSGKPVENSYIESFNGGLRDECLNVQVFFALTDVREKLEYWRQDYNQVRPHSALGDRSPREFVHHWQQSSAPSPRMAWPANQQRADAVHCGDLADPKPLQLFDPPSDVKGGAEKLPPDSAEPAVETTKLLEVVN
jgi:hypothetical protein